MPYPRPILKRFGASSSDDSDSPNSHEGGLSRFHASTNNKVHFPNHPDALTRMHVAHSPDDYDRSPIRIRPNVCALPERGCPGRTYSDNGTQMDMDMDVDGDDDGTGSRAMQRASALRRADHRHPCARVVGFLMNDDNRESSNSPPLMHDSSDTSEESDSVYSTPYFKDPFSSSGSASNNRHPSSSSPTSSTPSAYLPYPSPRLSPKADPAQLAFLPHPHSNPTFSGNSSSPSSSSSTSSSSYYSHSHSHSHSPEAHSGTRDSRSTRRSPSDPTRQRRRSRSRVRGSPVRDRHGFGFGSGGNSRSVYGGEADEGCLGGF